MFLAVRARLQAAASSLRTPYRPQFLSGFPNTRKASYPMAHSIPYPKRASFTPFAYFSQERLVLHSPRYLEQQLAILKKSKVTDGTKASSVVLSSIKKNAKVACLATQPEEDQVLGAVWVYSPEIIYSPAAMADLELEMRKRQCGLGLFRVNYEIHCLERPISIENDKTIPSYLIHYAVLSPIRLLQDTPPPSLQAQCESHTPYNKI